MGFNELIVSLQTSMRSPGAFGTVGLEKSSKWWRSLICDVRLSQSV